MVVSELRGEKIDIIPYNDEPARFVAKALSPARVREVLVEDETKEATVIVPDDQLSLAIGRDGQNARLAARLTGWKIDITSETEFAEQEEDIEYEGADAADGRCMAVLTTGRRCPNASLEGSQYCGLPQHQALARFKTNQVAVLAPLGDDEVATLADADADESAVKSIVERAEGEFDEAAAAEEAKAEEAKAEEAKAEEAKAERAEAEGAEGESGDADEAGAEETEPSEEAEDDESEQVESEVEAAEPAEEPPAGEDSEQADTEQVTEAEAGTEAVEPGEEPPAGDQGADGASADGDAELVSEREEIVDQQEAPTKAATNTAAGSTAEEQSEE
jgi:N utilization substance protein A